MTSRNAIQPDFARLEILKREREAQAQGRDYNPSADEVRSIMLSACERSGGVEIWAMRLGCKPGVLRSVLEGRKRPFGCMLDVLGLEWLPKIGAYANPSMDRRANAVWRVRMAKQLGFT